MTVIKINAITVPEGSGSELARRFAARAGAVDGQPGFEGFELLEPTDGRNVFEVEASVQPGNTTLRPGLEGVARLSVGRQPLAWTWTHRLVDWLRLQAWTLWG